MPQRPGIPFTIIKPPSRITVNSTKVLVTMDNLISLVDRVVVAVVSGKRAVGGDDWGSGVGGHGLVVVRG
jgi:hypothetical protein